MRRNTITDLLKKTPGYEVVYLLLQGPQRRQDLAEHINTNGGTLTRWLNTAEDKDLVTVTTGLRTNPQTQVEEKYIEVQLNHDIPDDLIPMIKDRGHQGHRRDVPEFTDAGNFHYWADDFHIDSQ